MSRTKICLFKDSSIYRILINQLVFLKTVYKPVDSQLNHLMSGQPTKEKFLDFILTWIEVIFGV